MEERNIDIEQTDSTSVSVVDAPTIKYDQSEIKPWLIAQQKWDILYKLIIFILLIVLVVINSLISWLYEINDKIIQNQIKIKDSEVVVKKINKLTNWVNFEQLKINNFLLENLFFVWDKNYEIIQKFYTFFKNPLIIKQLWDFKLKTISLKENDRNSDKNWLKKINIKIEWQFSSFNKDLKWMITFLNRMTPIVIIKDIAFKKGNNVVFTWYIYSTENNLFKFNYDSKYKNINKILRLKEEYLKNTLILDKILADKDLWLKKLWIQKLYNCKQYEEVIKKENLIKDRDIEQCKDVEQMLKNIKTNLDKSFNSL